MSPPRTFGPATPNRIAERPLIPPALCVFATGGTSVQYGLGGVIPLGQTIVAPLGAADSAMTATVTRPAMGASHFEVRVPRHVSPPGREARPNGAARYYAASPRRLTIAGSEILFSPAATVSRTNTSSRALPRAASSAGVRGSARRGDRSAS